MHDHHGAMRISKHALGVRSEHPTFNRRSSSFAHYDQAGLNLLGVMNDLVRWISNCESGLNFNLQLVRPFPDSSEFLRIMFLRFFENGVQLSAQGWLGRTNDGECGHLGMGDLGQRERHIQRVLGLW